MPSPKTASSSQSAFWLTFALLAAVLSLLFWRSFEPDYVHFSNDGPLGQQMAAYCQLPQAATSIWDDLNSLGSNCGSNPPEISGLLRWWLQPVGLAKFFAPVTVFILGLGAWAFFRAMKFSPLACALGGLVACLNSTFFSGACWGVGLQEAAIGLVFLALALVMSNSPEDPARVRWARLALAGLCVGLNVIEAVDIGALFSLLVALFIFYKSFVESEGGVGQKFLRGVGRVSVVAIFAGFIAFQTVISLVGTQIQGVAGTAQDAETKAQHWDWATQWSLPKIETLGLVVPGVFGYKMDTPKDMMPQFQDAYRGGVYWGGEGRSPEIDRFLDSGAQGQMPPGFMRFTGGGNYCGILAALLAAWAVAQSFRRQKSPFSASQKKLIWFWTATLVISLLLAWGRFAPMFYGLLYQLPYFSTIRNPDKFLFFFSCSLVVLFAYGVHALDRLYLDRTAAKSSGLVVQLTNWWAKAGSFDRKWVWSCLGTLGASALAWLIYSGQKPSLIQYLQKVGFPDEELARQIAAFSIGQAGWFLLLFATAILLVTLTIAGYFTGPRAKIGAVLLGAFLLFDLVRADLPYVIHWDYKLKYEVGSLNPIEDFLRQKPYEHRVAALPFDSQQQLRGYDNAFGGNGIYRIEWMQHHFPYYNIQCLDIIQMSRMPENLKAYLEALSPRGTPESVPLIARQWELTNTRYLLGAAGFLEVMNQQLDPGQHRFRIVQRFDIVPKPGFLQPQQLEELTALPAADGDLALFEFTGALPRAKLYSNWQVNPNDPAVLKTLADLNFDPAKTVLIDTPQKDLPPVATNENNGTVEFKSYAPKEIVFAAKAATPSVLLLNDKYDPNWQVTVDGRPAELLRCNFIMRGVYLPAGAHTVEFIFTLPHRLLYVTLGALAVGILLGVYLFVAGRKPIKGRSDDPKIPTAL
jgi:hypothetical protein